MKTQYIIVSDLTGDRFCKDEAFRSFALFGTFPSCVKIYRTMGWATNMQKLLLMHNVETTIIPIHDGDVMDASGRITRK